MPLAFNDFQQVKRLEVKLHHLRSREHESNLDYPNQKSLDLFVSYILTLAEARLAQRDLPNLLGLPIT